MVRSLEGKNPNYFEAILQLRDTTDEIKEFIEDELLRDQIPVTKIQKVTNGYDYYISDNNYTKALSRKLQQKFGGEILITSSLHTKKDGKDIYRTTVLFREAPFRKNDPVEYKGEQYKVISMSKEILLQNVKNGKKEHIKYKDMKQIKKA